MADISKKLIHLLDEQTQEKIIKLRAKLSNLHSELKTKLENYSMGIEAASVETQEKMRAFFDDIDKSLANITKLMNTEIDDKHAAEDPQNSTELNQQLQEVLDFNLNEIDKAME